MSELQRLTEDYLLEHGWTARPPIDPDVELRRIAYWRDPEHPTAAAVGLIAAVQRVIRRERRRAGAQRPEWSL